MTIRFIIIALAILPYTLVSQSDNPGGTNIVLDDMDTPITSNGSLTGATSNGAASCGTLANDDVFYTFNSTTKGAKFTLNSTDFDGVIELWDNAFNSVTCINNVNGAGEEVLFATGLNQGEDYHVRIHSADGVSGSGNFSLECSQTPLWALLGSFVNTSSDGDPYRMTDNLFRNTNGSIPVDVTRWKLRHLTTNEEFIYNVPNNNNNNLYFVSLWDLEEAAGTLTDPFMCYGDSMGVSVELIIEGNECGYGVEQNIYFAEEATTGLLDNNIGAFKNPNIHNLAAYHTHPDQVMEWEFYLFGNLVTTVTTAQGERLNWLDEIPGLLYNRPYEVRIRVHSCSIWGPWSQLFPFFTTNVPYVNLLDASCDVEVQNGIAIWCETIALATGYYWQVTPVDVNDPSMTPIGPAQVILENNSLPISSLNLAPATAYRVAVKPTINYDEQIGDYGYFCLIGTAGSGVNGVLIDDDADHNTFHELDHTYDQATVSNGKLGGGKSAELVVYPNPISSGQKLKIFLQEKNLIDDDIQTLIIRDRIGKIIHEETINVGEGIVESDFQFLNTGSYVITVLSQSGTISKPIFVTH